MYCANAAQLADTVYEQAGVTQELTSVSVPASHDESS